MNRSIQMLIACAGIATASAAFAAGAAGIGLANLENAYPGVLSFDWDGRTVAVYGVQMTTAAAKADAVSQFLSAHDTAFGAGNLELTQRFMHELLGTPKTSFIFDQSIDGVPVEFGRVTVLTHDGFDAVGNAQSSVVFASAKLAKRPADGFAPDTVSASDALAHVQSINQYSELGNWTTPEMVVYFGEGDFNNWTDSVHAWKFTAERYEPNNPRKFTFFVNSATNELIFVRNEIHNVDITGSVQGWVSPNNTADHPGNPPAITNMSEVLVRVQGQPATTVKANRTGQFSIPWAGTTPVTIEVSTNTAPFGANGVTTGQVRVTETGGAIDVYTASATPGTPALLIMNPDTGRTEQSTAEVNALYYLTLTRNYMADLAPSFAGVMDTIGGSATPAILPANTQVAGTCNAFYNGASTNYFPAGGNCNNTAFASVCSHEYGHHLVNRHGVAQGAFGEGFGDTMSILIYDDPVIGRFFGTTGGVVRLPDTDGVNYPCAGEIHFCGELLADYIIELRRALGNSLGSGPGLTAARQLHANWFQMTSGGLGGNSAHPLTVLEMLTVDDNDTNYCNGTPHRNEIITAGTIKNIPVPGLEPRLDMRPVATNPASAALLQPVTVQVDIASDQATLSPNSVRVQYRHKATNSFYTAPMTHVSGTRYQATIPGGTCDERIEYRFIAGSSQGDVVLPNACRPGPDGIPPGDQSYHVSIINTNPIAPPFFTNTFEGAGAGNGWTTAGTAATGQWTLGDPIGTAAQPESGSAGVNCWFTGQGTVGGTLGEADIDGGNVILTSPTFNLSTRSASVIALYDRWFSTGEGNAPYADVFRVQASADNGATWTDIEVIGPDDSPDTNPGWRAGSGALFPAGISGSAQTKFRFIAEDAADPSLVEAAIDNFRLAEQPCGCNDIDFNNDGSVFDPADIADFLNVFSEGACSTGNCDGIDFNNNASIFDPQDIDSFLSVFSEGPCIE